MGERDGTNNNKGSKDSCVGRGLAYILVFPSYNWNAIGTCEEIIVSSIHMTMASLCCRPTMTVITPTWTKKIKK